MQNTKKKVTITDIAREAGVSKTLVSFVLSNLESNEKIYRVSDETTRKVQEIIDKRGYRPSNSARILRSGRSRLIGVILSDISNRFFGEISRHIEDWSYQNNYTVIFGSTDESLSKMENLIEVFLSKGVDGFIIVPCEGAEDIIVKYKKQGIPIVLLDRDMEKCGLSCVILDNMLASSEMTEKLISQNHKKIEFVSYATTLSNIRDREKGYLEAMKAAGLSEYARTHNPRYGHYPEVEEIILDASRRGVSALIFATYKMVLLGRKATLLKGLADNITFACFNNSETLDIYEQGLIYVKQPIELFGRNSVELLTEQMRRKDDKNGSATKIVLPPQVEIAEL